MQGGFPQGVAYHPENADQPKPPYRIFNIDRGAKAAKKMSKNVSKITSYESLDPKYRSGKAAWANKRFTTHQDAISACAFFIYYIKESFLDRVSGGFTIGKLAELYTGESNWRQYASDVAKYLSKKLNRSITPNSAIEYNEPFMCALGEIIAVKEQSKNVTQYIHTAWSQANSA